MNAIQFFLKSQAYRGVLFLIYLVCFLAMGGLFRQEWRVLDEQVTALARERGITLFNLIEITREWNARHGGVYVPVTEETQPNPYLKVPQRDVVTQEGQRLTKINPAYMTRQIAETAELSSGVRFHITSLNPIRPGNVADAWEQESLARFEQGQTEALSYFEAGVDGVPVHRYMAPLLVKPSCMKCHAEQGYQVGDVRGGISVTMPADRLIALRDQRATRLLWAYGLAFVLLAGLAHGIVGVSRRLLLRLQAVNAQQENMIQARTADLANALADLREESDISAAVLENAVEGVIVTDANNKIVRVNLSFTNITGYSAEEVLGQDPKILKSGHHSQSFYQAFWHTLRETGAWQGEIWNRRKDGQTYLEWLSVRLVVDDGGRLKYIATFSDITRRKEMEEAMRHKAHFDPLTDLPNRSLFNDRLYSAVAAVSRYKRRFALVYLDLDYFKQVNDTLGHLAGDALLVEVAQRMMACVRESDTIARVGGDEFALVCPEVHELDEVIEIVERILTAISTPFHLAEGECNISVSVGVVLSPAENCDPEQMKRCADEALYAAKHDGRNCYRVRDVQQPGVDSPRA